MGLFGRIGTRRPSAELAAARELDRRLDFRPFNYHSITSTFITNAFPTADWTPAVVFSDRRPADVQAALERFAHGVIDVDALTEFVFGLPTFAGFVELCFETEKFDRGSSSAELFEHLAASPWTERWQADVDSQQPDELVFSCLRDAASRAASHSDVHYNYQDPSDPRGKIFADVARAGFMAVAEPFGATTARFSWKDAYSALDKVVGMALIPSPVVANPLTVLDSRQRGVLQGLCDRSASGLHRFLGDPKPDTFTGRPATPYVESLMKAAEHAAMLASIGIDPSACFVYAHEGTVAHRVSPSEFPWLEHRS